MGQEYVRIKAVAINTLDAGNGSDNQQQVVEQGFLVVWSPTGGFTGLGWTPSGLEETHSPLYNISEAEREQDMTDGNLNTTFSSWATRVTDPYQRYDWISGLNSLNSDCVIEQN